MKILKNKKSIFGIVMLLLLVVFYLYRLSVKYRDIDIIEFNAYLDSNNIALSEDNIIYHYYDFLGYDSISSVETSIKESDGVTQVSVIPRSTAGDSIASTKYVFDVDTLDNLFQVTRIRETWKCRKGRGHRYWSSTYCY